MWQRTNSLTRAYFKYVDLCRVSGSQEAGVGAYAKGCYGSAVFVVIDLQGVDFASLPRLIEEPWAPRVHNAANGHVFAIHTETSRWHDADVGRLASIQLVKTFV